MGGWARSGRCKTSPRYVSSLLQIRSAGCSPAHLWPERCPPANRECLLRGADGNFFDQPERLIQSVPRASAEVDGESRGAFRFACQQIRFDHVSDIGEVARMLAIAVDNRLRSIENSLVEE